HDDDRHLRSFPTRRSSDLRRDAWRELGERAEIALDRRQIVDLVLLDDAADRVLSRLENAGLGGNRHRLLQPADLQRKVERALLPDRKSTRLNSSHVAISYA